MDFFIFLAGVIVGAGAAWGYLRKRSTVTSAAPSPSVTALDDGPIQAGPPPTDPPLNNGGNA